MRLLDVRNYIASLGIADENKCYCGKMDGKKDKSIGVYPLKRAADAKIPLGGMKNASYGAKAISLLVHWNKSPTETEAAAEKLQEALMRCREEKTGEHTIKFIKVGYDEPISVGTDDNGIFEYVIECIFYYERSRGE